MNSSNFKVLSIAVASGKVGMVYMADGELMDWEFSSIASTSPNKARQKARKWIEFYKPDVALTEQITKYSRKSDDTQLIIKACADAAIQSDANHIEIERTSTHANKFDEIKELAVQFPQIAHLAPDKPPIWMPEPKATIYFEALSMAVQLRQPPANLPV